MKLQNPFEKPGRWFKANLHCHSTTSDGDASVAERVRQYRERGYDVLAITDHRKTNRVAGLSDEHLLVISGMETHPPGRFGGDTYHMVCLNVPEDFHIPSDMEVGEQIKAIKEVGAEYIIAHPYWCGHSLKHLRPMRGAIAVEAYNATCTKIGKGFSSVQWDDLLDIGRVLGGVAVDDTHGGRDIFMGWTKIKAERLTTEAIMKALRNGCYYASCGPVIEYFGITNGVAKVFCSAACEVHFISRRSSGCVVYADDGEDITAAEFPLYDGIRYVRAEVVDREGRHAWTNPITV